jgi:hypothetical protein
LRELGQEADGTLNTFFPAEAKVATGESLSLMAIADSLTRKTGGDAYTISSSGGLGAFFFKDVPADCSISFAIQALGSVDDFGCFLRTSNNGKDGYRLDITPQNKEVQLAESSIKAVEGLDKKISVQIVMKGDIIDVCIGDKRCIVNRLYEQKGTVLGFFARHGEVAYTSIKIRPLK